MHKKTIKDVSLQGKNVLVRVDYNVPINTEGIVQNDKRIRSTLPTLRYLADHGAKIVLITHLGRPEGQVVEHLRTSDIARVLSDLLKKNVKKINDCIGDEVQQGLSAMNNGDVLLLENVRFYPEEKLNDPAFSKKLSEYFDLFVNDGFGVSHRNQSSVTGVAKYLPSVAGLLVEKEMQALTDVRDAPKKPLVVVMGGVKLETRMPMIEQFAEKADYIIFGGAMIFTFLKAQGKEVGKSLVDDAYVTVARDLLNTYKEKLILPVDVVVAERLALNQDTSVVSVDAIPENMRGLDIGPETVQYFANICADAQTIIWNGPLGVFEVKPFNKGTEGFAREIIQSGACTVIGGGDTAAALETSGLADQMSFVSTGGGASLSLLEGGLLPGIEVLDSV